MIFEQVGDVDDSWVEGEANAKPGERETLGHARELLEQKFTWALYKTHSLLPLSHSPSPL